MSEVTYREFSRLGKRRGWTVEMLAELFKDKTGIEARTDRFHESLKSYFERVMTCQWLNPETKRMEDRGNIVIPYRAMIEFYFSELHASQNPTTSTPPIRQNRHGGYREGAGRKRVYATRAEKVHEYRKRMKRVTVYTKSSS